MQGSPAAEDKNTACVEDVSKAVSAFQLYCCNSRNPLHLNLSLLLGFFSCCVFSPRNVLGFYFSFGNSKENSGVGSVAGYRRDPVGVRGGPTRREVKVLMKHPVFTGPERRAGGRGSGGGVCAAACSRTTASQSALGQDRSGHGNVRSCAGIGPGCLGSGTPCSPGRRGKAPAGAGPSPSGRARLPRPRRQPRRPGRAAPVAPTSGGLGRALPRVFSGLVPRWPT